VEHPIRWGVLLLAAGLSLASCQESKPIARVLPPQFAALETFCRQHCKEGGGEPTEWATDTVRGVPTLTRCECSRATPKGMHTWHIAPAEHEEFAGHPELALQANAPFAVTDSVTSATVQCSGDGGASWHDATSQVVNGRRISKCR
jgi:hypothetical protein